MADLLSILPAIGYAGITAIVFAESGLLIGFFLPGDSLLFTAGFLASQGIFDIRILGVLTFAAAVAGDSVGYAFGHRVGRRLFRREDSILFHRDNLVRAEEFYRKHGKKTIILARFLPVIRTFAPIVAGIGRMHYPVFLAYNLIGGALWALGLSALGYFLGSTIENVDRYLIPLILGIILISLLPTITHLIRNADDRRQLQAVVRQLTAQVTKRIQGKQP